MLPGRATPQGTSGLVSRFPTAAVEGHYRQQQGVWMSSIGIGTYLGQPDEEDDTAYTSALIRAWEMGTNVIDTAINYRLQRSERAIGVALGELSRQSRLRREEVVVCTKAGFLTPDGGIPPDFRRYVEETYFRPGVMRPEDIAAGVHCMAPGFLADQIERSLRNLGLECLDVFYLHNPETQLTAVPRDEFFRRLRSAFELLERKVEEGKLQWYGTATWSGYRLAPENRDFLPLRDVVNLAREVGGEWHHFRFVQLPFNLAMMEALTLRNQPFDGGRLSLLEAAAELGLTVAGSASLMQANLAAALPDLVRRAIRGLATDAQRALQFARSAPGISVALVGMKDVQHVEENLRLAAVRPMARDDFLRFFQT